MSYYEWLKKNHPEIFAQLTPQAQARLKDIKYIDSPADLDNIRKLMTGGQGRTGYMPGLFGDQSGIFFGGDDAANAEIVRHETLHALQAGGLTDTRRQMPWYLGLPAEQRQEYKEQYLPSKPEQPETYPRFTGGGTSAPTRKLWHEFYWLLNRGAESHAMMGQGGPEHIPDEYREAFENIFASAPSPPVQQLQPTSLGGRGIEFGGAGTLPGPTPTPQQPLWANQGSSLQPFATNYPNAVYWTPKKKLTRKTSRGAGRVYRR